MVLKLVQKTINYLSFLILLVGILFISGCIEQQPIVPPSEKIIFTPLAELPEATEGVPYSYTFCEPDSARSGATCGELAGATTNPIGGNPPYSFSQQFGSGFIPPGLGLELNGLLRGTPTLPGKYTFGICVKDLKDEVCRTTSLTVKPKSEQSGSPYDGTYTGTFKYEYPSYSGLWGTDVSMVQDSFTLSITLKTRMVTSDTIYLYVTNVVSSNPDFGTGSNGFAPKHWERSTSEGEGYAYAELPTEFPSTRIDGMPRYIYIGFPNGKFLETSDVYVNLDPNTLTYYPDQSAQFWRSNGIRSKENSWDNDLSWSLTKVSS